MRVSFLSKTFVRKKMFAPINVSQVTLEMRARRSSCEVSVTVVRHFKQNLNVSTNINNIPYQTSRKSVQRSSGCHRRTDSADRTAAGRPASVGLLVRKPPVSSPCTQIKRSDRHGNKPQAREMCGWRRAQSDSARSLPCRGT
jgi:hypothetical protein